MKMTEIKHVQNKSMTYLFASVRALDYLEGLRPALEHNS